MYCVVELADQGDYWFDVLLERDWSMLKKLWLCNSEIYSDDCGITDDTISIFVNSNWPKLADLNLCNMCIMQLKIN